MKTDNIVLLGDMNCNLLGVNECSSFSDLQTKTRNLLHIFDVFIVYCFVCHKLYKSNQI